MDKPERVMQREDYQAVADIIYTMESKFIEDGQQSIAKLLIFKLDETHRITDVAPHDVSDFFDPKHKGGKDAIAHAIKKLLTFIPDDRILALVTEAWIADAKDKDDVHVMPSERPDRREAVIAVMHTKDCSIMAVFPISRNPNKLTKLNIDWETQMSGRMIPERKRAS